MAYTVQNLKSEQEAELHGTTLNQMVSNDQLIYRAARQLLLDIDPQETKRIAILANPLYDSVWDYACPSDLKGNKVIDIRPQANRDSTDAMVQRYNRDFDLTKQGFMAKQFTVNHNSGIKTLRIADQQMNTGITVDTADQLTGWAGNANVSNLSIDNTNFASGNGALKFDIAAATPGYVQKTITSLDLSAHLFQSQLFVYVYLPNPTDVTSINLQWGSSGGSYNKSVSVNQQNNAFNVGWNLLSFDWKSATVTGTPDPTKITSVRVTLNTDSTTQVGCRIDGIVSRLGLYHEIEYYSKYLFQDAVTGAWQETITNDGNIINLDTESYSLLLDQVMIMSSQQAQGFSAIYFDANYFNQRYNEGITRYKALYKSEVQKPQSIYYTPKKGGYGRFIGSRPY